MLASTRFALLAGLAVVSSSCASPHPRPPVVPHAPTDHYAGPVIDLHTHIFFDGKGGDLKRLNATPQSYLEREASLSRLSKLGVIVMAAKPGSDDARRLNDQLAAFVAKKPDRFIAIGSVHPADGEAALGELERMKQLGFRMVKLHPITQQFDIASKEVAAVVAKAAQLGMPVLFDFSGILNAADFGKYLLLAVENPDAQIVLAHMGGPKFHDLLLLSVLQENNWYRNNIWVDLSAVAKMYANSPYRDQLVFVIRKIGIDRVLFGSDFPFARTSAEAIGDVQALGFTADEERKIFYENASRLLNLGRGKAP